MCAKKPAKEMARKTATKPAAKKAATNTTTEDASPAATRPSQTQTTDALLGLAFQIAQVKLTQTRLDLELEGKKGEILAKELELEKLRVERERSSAEPVVAGPKATPYWMPQQDTGSAQWDRHLSYFDPRFQVPPAPWQFHGSCTRHRILAAPRHLT